MGIVSKPRVSMFWSTDSFYHTHIFGQVMSRKRHQLMQRFLHFQNNQDPQYTLNDPDRYRLFKIRTQMDMVRQKLNSLYYPPENLYIRTKGARYGIKMFELATANGILLDFMIYQGNIEPSLIHTPGQHWLQIEWIPLTRMEPYLDRGHTLTIENWYTTPSLAKYLLHRSTKVIGTVRSNNSQKIFQVTKRYRKDHLSSKSMKTCWQWNTEELRIKQLENQRLYMSSQSNIQLEW